ncbi:IS1595 family transposase [Chloroflexota bacterium]
MKTAKFTYKDFNNKFPNDDACLEFIFKQIYPNGVTCPKCQKVTKYYKRVGVKVYACEFCGHSVSPTAGTIFHKSSTSLRSWFHAMYLMSSTRCGISAKQLERETGVTYKTAWRMFKQIRTLLGEIVKLKGEVELDETYMGGKAINMHASKRAKLSGRGTADKTPVFGAVERKGAVKAMVVPNTNQAILIPQVKKTVEPNTTIYTDEMSAYNPLNEHGYNHHVINHSMHEYSRGIVHTNTIEGFWSLVKRGIGGVYHSVSPDYLQSYVNEYSFRYNHRKDETPMFQNFLNQIPNHARQVEQP